MARPPSTYEGRISTGKPIRSATFTASSTERAVPFAGCVMPRRSASASKRPRASAMSIESGGGPLLGTPPRSIGQAEDRGRCEAVADRLGITQAANGTARSVEEAVKVAERIGFPVLVRPSYVLGGRAMEIVYDQGSLRDDVENAARGAA